MYPHGDSRRRRMGQPPLAPQHLMGIAQQGPGVMVPMPNQPVQMMQPNYSAPYQPRQQSNSHYGPSAAASPAPFHQSNFTHPNASGGVGKQGGNRHKNYREDHKVLKDHNYNPERKKYQLGYHHRPHLPYNGHQNYPHASTMRDDYKMTHSPPITTTNTTADADADADVDVATTTTAVTTNTDTKPTTTTAASSTTAGITTTTTSSSSSIASIGAPAAVPEPEESVPQEIAPSPDSTTEETPMVTAVPNSKEKTPMCMVNELARFNKISHQYRLTNEQGPAHKKNFTVTLTLGGEEYTADGASIKKAQHAAAADALSKTSYSHPMPKNNKPAITIGKSNMTPTVELNALAMKRGEPAVYKLIEFPQNTMYQNQQTLTFRRPFGRGGRMPVRPAFIPNLHFTVSLKVGNIEYLGEGNSPQAARHNAAAKALEHLRSLPMPENVSSDEGSSNPDADLDAAIKSPVSLVHEIALKRSLNVVFTVISENGPPHMKVFVTECKVGEFRTEGEGNGKKISKKRAAEIMLKELRKLPPLSPSLLCSISLSRLKRKPLQNKKKTRNLIKVIQNEPKSETLAISDINPISKLIQIQQMKKEKEPVYTLLEEKGSNRRWEFFIEAAIGEMTAIGSGPNKKIAKKKAALNLLTMIEKQAKAETVKMHSESSSENPSGSSGRPLTENNAVTTSTASTTASTSTATATTTRTSSSAVSKTVNKTTIGATSTTNSAAKSNASSLQTALTTTTNLEPSTEKTEVVCESTSTDESQSPKQQLLNIGKILDFEVVFSNYPKANHKEHFSLVSLSTDPPQICHGSAATVEESQNIAAAKALKALIKMGADASDN